MGMPQVGVAAVFRVTPEMVKKSGQKPLGSFCPHCGASDVKVAGRHAGKCGKCGGKYRVDAYVDQANNELVGRIAWIDRNVTRMAESRARMAKQARSEARTVASKKDRLSVALKAKGWTEKFAKAGFQDRARIIAELAELGLVTKE